MKKTNGLIMVLLLVLAILSFHSRPVTGVPGAATSGFQILKYNNPNAQADLGVGLWAWPLPMDYDKDGDMDMLVSCPDKPFNGIYFLRIKAAQRTRCLKPLFACLVR